MAEVLSFPFPRAMKLPLDHNGLEPAQSITPSTSMAVPKKEDFEPLKHLVVEDPEVIMMEDIGFANSGISPVALSKPFQLFSKECVEQMRREIFEVRDKHPEHLYTSNIAPSQLRGYVPKYAPFTYDAWTHPETLAAISKIAGTDLVPWGNYEIAHINFSVKSEFQVQQELAELENNKRAFAEDEGIGGCAHEDDKPIVGWHRDSYPFVCVLMLSDCTNMIGGETAILKANGEVEKIRGPAMGCAAVLQGRYITHQALRALGAAERITAVTSFRPKSSYLRDDTVLTTVRPISDLSELYFEFAEYRMEMLVDRFQAKLKALRANHRGGRRTAVKLLKEFLEEQKQFVAHTNDEMVPYEEVLAGFLPDHDKPEVPLGLENSARGKRSRVD